MSIALIDFVRVAIHDDRQAVAVFRDWRVENGIIPIFIPESSGESCVMDFQAADRPVIAAFLEDYRAKHR